jgi:hypothetical protein
MHLRPSSCFPRKNRAFNSSSPPLVQGTKNVNETRGVSPRAQIKTIYSGEHIKRKLLMNPSKIIFTLSLKLIISTKKLARREKFSQQVQTKNTPLKFASSALESRFASILESSISNESPKHALQARYMQT